MTELEIKAAVRERDGNRCVECGRTNQESVERHGCVLDVHRKIPGSPYTIEGCETRCRRCHRRAHGYAHRCGKLTVAKVQAKLHSKIKMLALSKGVSIFDYMDAILQGPVNRDYDQMIREESR